MLFYHSDGWEDPWLRIFVTVEPWTKIDFVWGRVCLELFNQGEGGIWVRLRKTGESRHCGIMAKKCFCGDVDLVQLWVDLE